MGRTSVVGRPTEVTNNVISCGQSSRLKLQVFELSVVGKMSKFCVILVGEPKILFLADQPAG